VCTSYSYFYDQVQQQVNSLHDALVTLDLDYDGMQFPSAFCVFKLNARLEPIYTKIANSIATTELIANEKKEKKEDQRQEILSRLHELTPVQHIMNAFLSQSKNKQQLQKQLKQQEVPTSRNIQVNYDGIARHVATKPDDPIDFEEFVTGAAEKPKKANKKKTGG